MNKIFKNLLILNPNQIERIRKNLLSGISTEGLQIVSQIFLHH